MNLPKIIENNRKKLLDVITEITPQHDELAVATGYWDIEGMNLVLDHIKDYKRIRILIGREPLIKRDNNKQINEPEPDYPDQDFFEDLQKISPSPELKQVVIKMKEMIDNGQLEVRVYRRSFLHAKCYIFGGYDSSKAVGIIGSSNFTRNGMTQNSELNALESDHRVVTYEPKSEEQEVGHLHWFDQMWNDEKTEEWTGKFIELVRTSAHGDLLFSPHDMYLRTLYELYKHEIESEKEEIIHPHSKTLFEFQEKNVQNLRRILSQYGVAMLADSVGLGKTVSAIGVIKQYKNQRVVVIAPKSLTGQWRQELAMEGLHNVQVISLQNKNEIEEQQKIDKYSGVALFVIDESHNLRSHNGTRYETVSDWISGKYNEESHVLLVTATPINNSLSDLTSQILLGARGDQDIFTLTVRSSEGEMVTRSFYEAIDNIKKRVQQDISRGGENLAEIYNDAKITLEPIIRNFVVRNTRQSIKEIVSPDGSIKTFPEVHVSNITYKPIHGEVNVSSQFESLLHQNIQNLSDTMDALIHPVRQVLEMKKNEGALPKDPTLIYRVYQLILGLSFVPYRWRMYDFKFYGKDRDEIRQMRMPAKEKRSVNLQFSLYGIMRTLFLKRLESSAYALNISLKRYKERLEIFEHILRDENMIINLSDIDDVVDEYAEDDGDQITLNTDELVELARKKPEEVDANFNKDVLFEDIQIEKDLIDQIVSLVEKLQENDPKLQDIKDVLQKSADENPDKKLLIFSFFADTIDYIQKSLEQDPDFKDIVAKSAFVSGRDRVQALQSADRFAPIAKDAVELAEKEGELTYLFATDVLSEGQNLQDCGAIINYDLHWNPVRMVQRNGRINRLGSSHDIVTVQNFTPGEELEEFLGLMQRLQNKINLIKHAIGTESSLFGEDIDPRSYTGLYSENADEATAEYEKLESSLDAFSDDIFLKDIKGFYESASDEEIRQMERIPFDSWGILPHGIEGSDSVVLFSNLKYENGNEKFAFFTNETEANAIDIVPNVVALQMIKSTMTDKPLDTITIDRDKHLSAMMRRGPQIAIDTGVDRTLTPTKENVLNEAKSHGFSGEDIDRLRATLSTRNVTLGRKVSRLVRSINAALKESDPADEYYESLKELLVEKTEQPEIEEVDFLLGYTDQYEK